MKYIGIDQHKDFCQVTVVDKTGRIVERKKVPSTTKDLQQYFRKHKGAKAVIESNTVWEFIYETLDRLGIQVVLTNPLEVKAIAHAKKKTDKIDSETLAHLLRSNMVPESYIAPKAVRELRKDVKGRIYLTKTSTSLGNQLYAELIRKGIEYEKGFLKTKKGRREMAEILPLPRVLRKLALLDMIEQELKEYNRELLLPAFTADPKAKILTSIDGVGFYTALTVVACLGDIDRFHRSDSVVCYAGLVSRTKQSANSLWMGPITKAGPPHLRFVLIEAMRSHLKFCKSKKSCKLCNFYRRVRKKHKENVSITAGAAKLLRIMYWMLKLNQNYRPQGLDPVEKHEGEPRLLNGDRSLGNRSNMDTMGENPV